MQNSIFNICTEFCGAIIWRQVNVRFRINISVLEETKSISCGFFNSGNMLSLGSCWPCIFLYSVYMMTLWVRCFTKPHQEPGKTAENLHEPLKTKPSPKEPYSDGVISNDVVFRLTRLGFAIMWTGHTGVNITTFLSRLFNFLRPWLWGTSPIKYKRLWESTDCVVSFS